MWSRISYPERTSECGPSRPSLNGRTESKKEPGSHLPPKELLDLSPRSRVESILASALHRKEVMMSHLLGARLRLAPCPHLPAGEPSGPLASSEDRRSLGSPSRPMMDLELGKKGLQEGPRTRF